MIDFDEMIVNAPILMGVVNVTPDSFSDGGDFLDSDKAITHALKLLDEGADILDIGGESTRPGAKAVSLQEEQSRILPVIKGVKEKRPDAIISVDTRNAETMQKSIELGADIINDISALTHDGESLPIVVKAQVPVIIMHMQGSPDNMQDNPSYNDVVGDVYNYLKQRIEFCTQAGVAHNNIIIDVGIGFGKTLNDNLKLLKNIDKFNELECSVLLGASRKSFIGKICPQSNPQDRLAGSIATMISAYQKGVSIFRVHDVAESRQALDVFLEIENS